MYVQRNEDGTVRNSWTETGEWFPDDTVIRMENEEGQEVAVGAMRISRHQPEGWERAAAKRWDHIQKQWLDTGAAREPNGFDAALQRIEQADIPNPQKNPTVVHLAGIVEELTAVVRDMQRFIVERDKAFPRMADRSTNANRGHRRS